MLVAIGGSSAAFAAAAIIAPLPGAGVRTLRVAVAVRTLRSRSRTDASRHHRRVRTLLATTRVRTLRRRGHRTLASRSPYGRFVADHRVRTLLATTGVRTLLADHRSTDASRHDHRYGRFSPPPEYGTLLATTGVRTLRATTGIRTLLAHRTERFSSGHPYGLLAPTANTDASRHHPSTDASRSPSPRYGRFLAITRRIRTLLAAAASADASRPGRRTGASDRRRRRDACRRDPGNRLATGPGRCGRRRRCGRHPASAHRLDRPAWGAPGPPSRASNRSRFSCRVWSPHRTQPYCGRRWNGPLTRNGHPSSGGHSSMNVRRCPTLPQGRPCSTIGAASLSFRVRNVSGRFPRAMAAETRATPTLPHRGWVGCVVSVSRTGPGNRGSGVVGVFCVVLCGFPSVGNHRVDASNLEGHSHGLSMNDLQTCVSVVIVKLSAY